MNITIKKPLSINEAGKRIKYKDSIYPDNEQASSKNRLFLICDGVGSSNNGDVASSIACDSIHTYFHTFIDTEKVFDPTFIEKALQYAEVQFDEYIRKNSSAKGMATTLSLLYFAPNGIYLTHVGYSRIYQFRGGKIIFRTEDNTIQVSQSPAEINITKITDVLPYDEFFMCSDGVTEVLSDDDLCKVFSTRLSPEAKINTIREYCRNNAKGNYSAYLIPIQEINKINFLKQLLLYLI